MKKKKRSKPSRLTIKTNRAKLAFVALRQHMIIEERLHRFIASML